MTDVAEIIKNSRECIRITLDEYQGHDLVNIRVWYDAGDGEMRPTKKGLAFKTELLTEVREALSSIKVGEGVS